MCSLPRSRDALDLLAAGFSTVPDYEVVTGVLAQRLAALFAVPRVSIGRFHLGYGVRSYVPDLVVNEDPHVLRHLARAHPAVAYAIRTKADRAFRMSDVVAPREMHRLDVYHEYLRPGGVEYQLFCTLAGGHGEMPFFVALSRPRDDAAGDFTGDDVALLDLLSAPLGHLLTSVAHTTVVAATPLTSRESEVMHLVVLGLTNADVARILQIRPATVKKHIENILTKYGVSSRSGAVAAWAVERRTSSRIAGSA